MNRPVIIGAGLAGLTVALFMAPRPVVVLGRRPKANQTSSALAQGGLAAAVGAGDSPLDHARDTMAAGAGLCDEAVVRSITKAAPQAIEQLLSWGVPFDRDDKGTLALGLEGAHSRRRIVHACGDSTGAVIMRTLVEKVLATPSIMFLEGAEATALKTSEKGVCGVVFRREGEAQEQEILTDQVILATGSACALWQHMTVPSQSWGHGLALAARAGARLRDLEFVQFHPTALDVGVDPMPLLSEALRGDGARLVTEDGKSFVDELLPRDIVSRAIWREKHKGSHVFLDARDLSNFKKRFPTVWDVCHRAGIDPTRQLLPINAVAHYHMGGVATDGSGRTNVTGLWACGEGACTGLHGANRLASNSLLEAVVMGLRVAQDVRGSGSNLTIQDVQKFAMPSRFYETAPVRQIMGAYVGVVREKEGLSRAVEDLAHLAKNSEPAFVGEMMARAALARCESRGGHYRSDYPVADDAQAQSCYVTQHKMNPSILIAVGA